MGMEYRYLADTPKHGTQPLTWPLASPRPDLRPQYEASARRKWGKGCTVRVEQREVTEWVTCDA